MSHNNLLKHEEVRKDILNKQNKLPNILYAIQVEFELISNIQIEQEEDSIEIFTVFIQFHTPVSVIKLFGKIGSEVVSPLNMISRENS